MQEEIKEEQDFLTVPAEHFSRDDVQEEEPNYTLEEIKYLTVLQKNPRLQEIEISLCKKNPFHWLTMWAYTLDSHDKIKPVKKFPKKRYIQELTELWVKEPLLLVPKSRQMMATWLFCALYLWEVQFNFGALVFFQSKKEEDADSLVQRAKFIYDFQPSFLKRNLVNPTAAGGPLFCKLSFPKIHSEIRGIPQGGAQIRMHTASGVFSDEMAFQPEAEEAYIAAKPTIDGGGRFTGVSTANPGFFEDMVFDRVQM